MQDGAMSLTLYYHPLSSFCMKVLVPLYEAGAPFEKKFIDLSDEASRAELLKVWPVGRFPVLRDEAEDRTIPESTIIIEYLAQRFPEAGLIPADPDRARQTRLRDRFYDLNVEVPVQKIVGDRLRPEGAKDPYGVEQARGQLRTVYGMIEQEMASRTWAMGDDFTMADCAAAPALFYAAKVEPFDPGQAALAGYLDRLMARPSFARALKEAEPYFHMFPQ
jgi:glutathione S-transferase